MSLLVIIDGNAILHRAFHALPPLTTSKGIPVNAAFGFTSMLLRVIEDLKPTHLAVTFDRPAATFRKKMYENYQAKRPKMDESLIPQVETVHRVVKEMGFPVFEMDGYEADDVIGTLVSRAKSESVRIRSKSAEIGPPDNTDIQRISMDTDMELIIVTGDRDILQLVDEQTKVYMPVKGLSQSKMYGEKEVVEKFGIKSAQIVDYKALVGDSSDNYPGVPGIGPKSASALLQEFGTLEKLFESIDQVKSMTVQEKLRQNKDSAEMCKKLATIVCDVPIEIDWEKLEVHNLLKPSIVRLFEELEFRSLIPRLGGKVVKQITNNKRQITKNKKKENSSQISLF